MLYRTSRSRICTLTLLLGLAAGSQLHANRVVQDLFYDAIDVPLVDIEVVVTDSDGNPVTGLTREDFEVLENGEPVELTHFFAVVSREPQADDDGLVDPYDPGPFFTPETERLHLVVFIDNFNIRPENRNVLLRDLRRHLKEELDPRDRVMLVTFNDNIDVAHGFSNDADSLLATLDRLELETGRLALFEAQVSSLQRRIHDTVLDVQLPDAFGDRPGSDMSIVDVQRLAREVEHLAAQRVQRVERSVEALRRFTDSLAGLGGRKALLYVSDGLPVRPAESLAQAWVNRFESWIVREQPQMANELQAMTSLGVSGRYDMSRAISGLVAHASSNRVAFYPISNSALQRTSLSAEFTGATTPSGRGAFSRDVFELENTSREMSLLELASGTGGVAFTRTSNLSGLLDRIERDFTNFYSMAYTPTMETGDGPRDIEVRVKNRRGLQVRHFRTLEQQDPLERLQDLTLSALYFDLEHNPLGVQLVEADSVRSGRDRYQVTIMVQVPIRNLLLVPDRDVHAGQLSLFVIAQDERGGLSPMQQIEIPIRVPNAQLREVLRQAAGYPLELEIRGNTKRIAIGLRDRLAHVDSTVKLDLSVGRH